VDFMDVCSRWLEGTHKECASSLQDLPVSFQHNCTVADDYTTRMSMVPKKWPTGLPLNGFSLPMDDPPQVPGGTCNFAMPDDSTRDRYVWVSGHIAATAKTEEMSMLPCCQANVQAIV
jgi:hypothetical protein